MGRWDDRPTRDFNIGGGRDDWNKEFDNNFDWKETPLNKHMKKCNCPKCEYFIERRKNPSLPIVYKYCPAHYKVWFETQNEMMNRLNWFQRQVIKFLFWAKVVVIKELTYAQSDLCFWCKFGSGGRGIKDPPTIAPEQ